MCYIESNNALRNKLAELLELLTLNSRLTYKLISRFSIMLILSLFLINTSKANNFYEERYNSWIYFNDEVKKQALEEKMRKQIEKEKKKEEFVKARREVEQFAKELEELKFMMIRYPENLEHVAAYKKKEAIMFENAMKLDSSYRLVNYFTDPSGIDSINNPVNLYGRKIKNELDQGQDKEKNRELAKKVELFFFFSTSCPYSNQAEPILKHFADKYNYRVEAISIDGGSAKYFKTHQNKELVEKLGITQIPVVIAVSDDSSIRFEFIRGAVSLPELEERGVLALQYLNNLKAQANDNTKWLGE